MSSAARDCWAKPRPMAAVLRAAITICHLRSMRSEKKRNSSGESGNAMAMMNEFCKPARRFRDAQANPPDHQRADRGNEHKPSPAGDAKRIARNQLPRQKGNKRHSAELHCLINCEGFAADALRH